MTSPHELISERAVSDSAPIPYVEEKKIPPPEEDVFPSEEKNDEVEYMAPVSEPIGGAGQYLLTSKNSGDGSAVEIVQRPEDNLFILEMVLNKEDVISEGMLIYIEEDDDLLIPLSEIVNSLMFQINVDPASGSAEGWFVSEDRTFRLNYPYNEVIIAGESVPITGVVETHVNEIYVSRSELEKWFPIQLDMNFNELRLYLIPTEDLPFQALAQRRSRWKRIESRSHQNMNKEYENALVLPYKMWAAPSIQLTENFGATKTDDEVATTFTSAVQTQGDMLGMSSRFNLSYQQQTGGGESGFNSAYFNLSKRDHRSNLLGFLNATNYELGDVNSATMPLAGGQQRGRGFSVGNTPYNFVRDPSEFYIEGFAPDGWDVEVYQDERLLSFQTVPSDGRYEFTNIDLREGFNLFRIVLYGPNGEREERYERYYLGRNMVGKGKFIYEMSALESSTPLLNVANNGTTDPTLSLYGEYGLTDNLSAHAGFYSGPLSGGTLNAFGTGVRFGSNSAYYQFDTLYDTSGAYSASIDATGNISRNITLRAGHEIHEGYEDNLRPTVEESYVNMTQRFSEGFFNFGSYSFGANRKISDTDVETYSLTNNVSGSFFNISATNNLEYEVLNSGGTTRFLGDLTLRRRTPIGMLRGRLDYSLDDTFELDSVNLLYQTYIDERTTLNLYVNSVLTDGGNHTLSGAFSRRFDKFQLTTNASVDDKGDMQVGLQLGMNFIPQSLSGDYRMTGSASDLYLGHLEMQPYLDLDEDGEKDENEEAIAGVKMRNMLRNTKGETGEDGTVMLAGLSPDVVNRITVDAKSLPSIYMTPAQETISVIGRQGVSGPVGYPLILLGELSGTLYAIQPGETEQDQRQEISGLEMLLLNEKSEVVAQTYSEYDGFFIFSSLRMGKYRLYIPPSPDLEVYYQGDGLGPSFTLSPDNPEYYDANILLLPDQIVQDNNVTDAQIQTALASIGEVVGAAADMALPQIAAEAVKATLPEKNVRILPTKGQKPESKTKKKKAKASIPSVVTETKPDEETMHVQAGFYCEIINATRLYETLLIAGFSAEMNPRTSAGKKCYTVDINARRSLSFAEQFKIYLVDMGLEGAFIDW